MSAKEYLLSIKQLERAIKLKKEEIEELRTLATSITVKTGEEPVQTSGTSDKVGNIVAKIVDLQRELEDSVIAFLDKRDECIDLMGKMKNIEEYELLYRRYIQDMKWEEVGNVMGYSDVYVRGALHLNALTNFENILREFTE